MPARLRFTHSPLTPTRFWSVIAVLAFLLFGVSLLALAVGTIAVPFPEVLSALLGQTPASDPAYTIVCDIRLPRVLLGLIVGASLSVAGVILQALLRNPLAEPYILGISSGGTLGLIIVVTFFSGTSPLTAPIASFLGSAAVLFLVYGLGRRRGQLDPYALLLSGIMVGAFFNAAILLAIAVSNQELRSAYLWLMGNVSGAQPGLLIVVGPLVIVGTILAFWRARHFNLIATGEDTAIQLGVEINSFRRFAYLLASFMTGLAVSISGVVGFVGLIIPHVVRMLFGPDHRLLIPAAFLLGAGFLVAADILARIVIAPAEIPVGAVTAAIGAPVFLYLLRKR
jgi:iron complex transport system permease protein